MYEPVIRLYKKTVKVGSCWHWTGAKNPKGYGNFSVGGVQVSVHRFSYELYNGHIPEGLTVDHSCNNTSCINPDHLRLMTNERNNARGQSPSAKNARKERCPKGHHYTKYMVKGKPRRECLTCRNDRRRSRV